MGEAAELVDIILEGVRVDRAERHTKITGIVSQRTVILDLVPRDVQRHLRREPGQLIHLGGVGDFSWIVRGVPGVPKTLNRVPEFPNAHEGSSMA